MDSNLQIISGKFRGKKLRLPPGARPTQNRARIALFNMLRELGAYHLVWDAFAGSGAFGIECISRNPNARAIFTDTDAGSIRAIRKNLGSLSGADAIAAQTDAVAAIPEFGADADLIFIDPPYAKAGLGAEFIKKLARVAKPGALIVWEMEKTFNPPPLPANIQVLKEKIYGRAKMLITRASQ
jgi:16S rRNA (guanine966-N2)-methyltransferase